MNTKVELNCGNHVGPFVIEVEQVTSMEFKYPSGFVLRQYRWICPVGGEVITGVVDFSSDPDFVHNLYEDNPHINQINMPPVGDT